MSDVQNAVNQYFYKRQIDIERLKEEFKRNNEFKFFDNETSKYYTWGVRSGKLYIEKLKIK